MKKNRFMICSTPHQWFFGKSLRYRVRSIWTGALHMVSENFYLTMPKNAPGRTSPRSTPRTTP